MVNCDRCKEKLTFFQNIEAYSIYDAETNGIKKYCKKCADSVIKENAEKQRIKDERDNEEERKQFEEIVAKAPKIQCPYCKKWFPKLTEEQYRHGAGLNLLKWALVPEWGVVGALKNKPYIECPHCKMKIMQG